MGCRLGLERSCFLLLSPVLPGLSVVGLFTWPLRAAKVSVPVSKADQVAFSDLASEATWRQSCHTLPVRACHKRASDFTDWEREF